MDGARGSNRDSPREQHPDEDIDARLASVGNAGPSTTLEPLLLANEPGSEDGSSLRQLSTTTSTTTASVLHSNASNSPERWMENAVEALRIGAHADSSSFSGSDEDVDSAFYGFGWLQSMLRQMLNEEDGRGNESAQASEVESDMDDAIEEEEGHFFDPAIPTRHSYLGDIDDIRGGYGRLEDDSECYLPLIAYQGVVLFPGCMIPLRVVNAREREAIEQALVADSPVERLVAIVNIHVTGNYVQLAQVGCTAEIRQLGRSEEGVLNLVAVGRQRIKVDMPRLMQDFHQRQMRALVTVLPDAPPVPVPREFLESQMYWKGWAAKMFDAHHYARKAYTIAQAIIPQVKELVHDPLALSFWLSANLPLIDDVRQSLLEEPTALDRLKALLGHMKDLSVFYCNSCGVHIAKVEDMTVMSEEGSSGVFVNPSGCVHDMITVKGVENANMIGDPQIEHSWFPGYAWIISECRVCGEHLGWCFKAAEKGLKPASFWGLRRSQLTCVAG